MELVKSITIINKLGLHARAASKLVALASKFESQIILDKDGQEADAKSIMALLMLAASQGTSLTVRITGRDATDALEQLEALINDRFGEGE